MKEVFYEKQIFKTEYLEKISEFYELKKKEAQF